MLKLRGGKLKLIMVTMEDKFENQAEFAVKINSRALNIRYFCRSKQRMPEKLIYYRMEPVTPETEFKSLLVKTEEGWPVRYFNIRGQIQDAEGIDDKAYTLQLKFSNTGQLLIPPKNFEECTIEAPHFDAKPMPWPAGFDPEKFFQLTFPYDSIEDFFRHNNL